MTSAAAAKKELETVLPKTPEYLRVVYVSDLLCDKAEVLGELFNIVHVAAKFNRAHGIGGFFTADKEKRICVQMFEGPYEICNELWSNIQKDVRHTVRKGAMISHPDKVLKKWGMPLMKPANLLRNFKSLGIDATDLITSVLSEKKAPVDTSQLEKKLAEKIRADTSKDESEKPLNQAKLGAMLEAQAKSLERARQRSDAELKNLDVPQDQQDDLKKAYSILAAMVHPRSCTVAE